jgi:hypothetical protein
MLRLLCRQHYGFRPKIETGVGENKISTVSITINGDEIGAHSSSSYTYARKRAIEKALKLIAQEQEKHLQTDERHLQIEEMLLQKQQEIKQKAKAEQQEKHIRRTAAHQERMSRRFIQKKKAAQAADLKRRLQKQEVKEEKASRKGANSLYREYTREEIAAMSNAKRRNLQDRGIIPKGLNF